MNPSQAPYFVAVAYAVIVAAVGIFGFQTLPPRFMDLFLVGIAFVTARWSWRPALVLYVLSLVTAAWVLPPRNSFVVSEGYDQLRMALYGASSLAVIIAIEYARARGHD